MKLNLIEDNGVRFEMDIEDNKLMLDVAKVAESLRKDVQPKVDGSIELWLEAFVAMEYLRWANERLANWFAEKLNELISDGTISCD